MWKKRPCAGRAAPHVQKSTFHVYDPRRDRDKADGRLRTHQGNLARELARQPPVVGVEKCDKLTARFSDTRIACVRKSTVGLPYDLDSITITGQDNIRVVGAAVIDHQQFEVPELLGQHTVYRFVHAPCRVKGRNDHADRGRLSFLCHNPARASMRQSSAGLVRRPLGCALSISASWACR